MKVIPIARATLPMRSAVSGSHWRRGSKFALDPWAEWGSRFWIIGLGGLHACPTVLAGVRCFGSIRGPYVEPARAKCDEEHDGDDHPGSNCASVAFLRRPWCRNEK